MLYKKPEANSQKNSKNNNLIKFGVIFIGLIILIYFLGLFGSNDNNEELNYIYDINTWTNEHSEITSEQNRLLEKLTPLLTSGNENAFLELYEALSNNRLIIRSSCEEFRGIIPPKKYTDTHLIMANGCADLVEASNSWVTIFSTVLNGNIPSDNMMNNSRQLLRNYNQARIEFSYKYMELSGQEFSDQEILLLALINVQIFQINGGAEEARTPDPLLAKTFV